MQPVANKKSMQTIRGVLFDLDGTLLDTAPDLMAALNNVRSAHQLESYSLHTMRSIINLGSKALIKQAFNLDEENAEHKNKILNLRENFLQFYEKNITQQTQFFPQIEEVLAHLAEINMPWGIVTNKLTRHTTEILKTLQFISPPSCVICGDTLKTAKPDPAPILHACELLQRTPNECLFIGDALTDVLASKAAGTKSLVALYGYINHGEDPNTWQADGYIKEPKEILQWL